MAARWPADSPPPADLPTTPVAGAVYWTYGRQTVEQPRLSSANLATANNTLQPADVRQLRTLSGTHSPPFSANQVPRSTRCRAAGQ